MLEKSWSANDKLGLSWDLQTRKHFSHLTDGPWCTCQAWQCGCMTVCSIVRLLQCNLYDNPVRLFYIRKFNDIKTKKIQIVKFPLHFGNFGFVFRKYNFSEEMHQSFQFLLVSQCWCQEKRWKKYMVVHWTLCSVPQCTLVYYWGGPLPS